jgi:hypothetical protein
MKRKYFLIVLFLILSMFLSGCGGGNSTKDEEAITPEIKQEIKTLSEGSASKYISITDIRESSGSISEVKMWTDAVCESCYKILKKHDLDYFIHVWAKRPKGEDFVKIYGRTNYDKYSGIFKFKDAKELNL